MKDLTFKCPHCCEILTEEEAESVCDCGCPSCRKYFDIEDFDAEDNEKENPSEA